MDVLSMRWRDVLVASWPVDPDRVDDRLPDGVSVDTFDGRAWLSVVPFVMADVRPRGVPARFGATFGELNLRTYVTAGGRPGVYFFNLDATDPVGVRIARALFRLPYYDADMTVERRGDRVDFESERTHGGAPDCEFAASYAPVGDPEPAADGSLAAFLLERYRFFVAGRNAVYRGEVHHDPWRLAPAEFAVERNDLFAANGFEHPDGTPHVLYSPGVDVTAALPKPV
ncbi:MAG: YqjF family protein [Halobacterium sp.]